MPESSFGDPPAPRELYSLLGLPEREKQPPGKKVGLVPCLGRNTSPLSGLSASPLARWPRWVSPGLTCPHLASSDSIWPHLFPPAPPPVPGLCLSVPTASYCRPMDALRTSLCGDLGDGSQALGLQPWPESTRARKVHTEEWGRSSGLYRSSLEFYAGETACLWPVKFILYIYFNY